MLNARTPIKFSEDADFGLVSFLKKTKHCALKLGPELNKGDQNA